MNDFEFRILWGLGAATGRVIPAIVVVLVVATFARQFWAFLLAGMLPTLFLPAVALLAWLQLGSVAGTFRDDPVQQVFDIVLSLIAGAIVGYAAYVIKQRLGAAEMTEGVQEKVIDMSDLVKAAIIVGVAIICATAIWVYFSPYQTCVRERGGSNAAAVCAALMGGKLKFQ